ncbi:MAG: bifunctional DNA primase/polymerase [Deltaproteobacteria bacterium]|nr:bifunctional DNA primase/polymerase [Deltaproteobacteria bacterium]
MKAAALDLAARGIFVFPLAVNGKTPITLHGYQDASTDPKRIEEMWQRCQDANIGIATGASGLVVIDIDVKHGVNGWKAFDDCLERLGELPGPTRMASTPSGGAHIYFREPAGAEIRNSAGRLGPGLDVRAHGGYVVAPPSVIEGKAYRWDITEPAKVLPDAWAEAMQPPKPRKVDPENRPVINRANRYGVAALNDETDIVANAQPGQRNDTLTRSAFKVGTVADQCGVTRAQAEEMFAWAVSQWKDVHEARKAADSFWRAFEAGRNEPRQLELQSRG